MSVVSNFTRQDVRDACRAAKQGKSRCRTCLISIVANRLFKKEHVTGCEGNCRQNHNGYPVKYYSTKSPTNQYVCIASSFDDLVDTYESADRVYKELVEKLGGTKIEFTQL